MCENCGINHDTNELEDQDALNAFLGRLVSGDEGDDSSTDDLFSMLAELFGGEEEVQEPLVSYMDERGLTPEFELNGEFMGKPWAVKVAQIPIEDIEEEHRDKGSQWWTLDGYWDGKLVRSSEGAPPEPVTAKQAAEVYAEFHFDYVIPA